LPYSGTEAIPVIYQEKIFICGGTGIPWNIVNQNCWNYNPTKNTWDLLTTSKFAHSRFKLYLLTFHDSKIQTKQIQIIFSKRKLKTIY
jgi:hypothetical protein